MLPFNCCTSFVGYISRLFTLTSLSTVGGLKSFLFVVITIFMSQSVWGASGITYHGRIVKPNNQPLESATTRFRIQIKSPNAENCLLWEEEQTRNMLGSNGVFTITIGDSTDTMINYARVDTYGWGMERVFSNRSQFSALLGCTVGNSYLPNPADGRILEVSFKEASTDPTWEAFPATKINLIPMSLNSLQLEGFRSDEFLKVDPYVNQTPINNAGVNTLLSLIAGTSNLYVKPADPLGGDLSGTIGAGTVVGLRGRALGAAVPAVGQVLKFNGSTWEPSADDTGGAPADASYAAKGIVQFDTSAAVSGVTVTAGVARLADTITAGGPMGGASVVPVITYDSKGRLTAVTTTAVNDVTKLPLAGGTMTGPIDMGLQNITNATSVAATNFSGRNLLLSDSDTDIATIRAPINLADDYTLTLPVAAPVNGYVLSTDAGGQLSWIAAATGSVTSVGATSPIISSGGATPVISLDTGLGANKIPQVGGTALGANGVVVANAMGTALSTLNCTVGQVIKFDASGFATCAGDDAGAANAFVQNGNAFGAAATLGTNDNFDLNFETNGATRMTVLANGNVGVGTVSPGEEFSIRNDQDDGTYLNIQNASTGTLAESGLYLSNDSGAIGGIYTASSTATEAYKRSRTNVYAGGGSTGINIWSNAPTSDVRFIVGGDNGAVNERMRITSGGNVGIGTTNPTATLDVDKTITLTSGTYKGISSNFSMENTSASTATLYGIFNDNSYNSTFSGGTLYGSYNVMKNNSSGSVSTLYANFNQANSGVGSATTTQYGTYSSSIARGNTTDSYGSFSTSLTNNNLSSTTNAFGAYNSVTTGPTGSPSIGSAYGTYSTISRSAGTITNGYGLYIGGVQATNKWSLYSNDATAPSYFAGNVGVGTTAPVTKLDISGAVRIGNDATACAAGLAGSLRYNGGLVEYCNGSSWQAFGVSGAGLASLNGQTGSTQTFSSGAAGNAPAISSAGNVHTLNVPLASTSGTVTSGSISNADYVSFTEKLTSPLTTKGDLLSRDGSTHVRLPAGTDGQILSSNSATASGLEWVAAPTGDITSVVAGAGLITGGNSGDVTLDVAAGNGITVLADSVAVDTGLGANKIPQVGGTALGANGVVVADGTGAVLSSLNCSVGQVIKFDASGFALCAADNETSSNDFLQNGNSFGGAATLGTNDNFALNFETNGSSRMTILSTGNVGIGTTNPLSPFHSAGNVRIGDNVGNTFSLLFDNAAVDNTITGGSSAGFTFAAGTQSSGSPTTRVGSTFTNANSGTVANVYAVGVEVQSTLSSTVGTNALTAILANPLATNISGTIDNAYGFRSTGTKSGAGTLTNYYGVYGAPMTVSAGAVTNNFAAGFNGAVALASNNANGLLFTSAMGTAADTNLYRSAAGYLRTDTSLSVGGSIGVGVATATSALDLNGVVTMRGLATPALSPAGQGRIYFDSASNTFKVSENGGAYVSLGGGGATELPVAGGSAATPGYGFSGDTDTGLFSALANTLGFSTGGTERILVSATGDVGIGTTSPNSKLTISGAATSRTNIIASGAVVDLSLSNNHLLKSVGGSVITLQNLADGGVYNLAIFDTTDRTYTFTGCTNTYFSPGNGPTTFRSSYSIAVMVDGANTECLISWSTGFN